MIRKIALASLAVALCAAVSSIAPASAAVPKATPPAAAPEFFAMPPTGSAPLPLSEAVQVGDMLYVSGQVGVLPGTLTLAPGGVVAEARQALENIKSILQRHGSSLDQVVKCTVFLADIKEWPALNGVYSGYFKAHFPARSAVATNGLALGARTEIECIAFVPHLSR